MESATKFRDFHGIGKIIIIVFILLWIPITGFIFGAGSWLLIQLFNWFLFFDISSISGTIRFTTGATVVGWIVGFFASLGGLTQLIE